MSNLRSFVFFASCSALLALLLLFSAWRSRNAAAARGWQTLTHFDADAVERVEIDVVAPSSRGCVVLEKKAEGRWSFGGEAAVEAETSAVLEMLDAFVCARSRDALSDSEIGRLGRTLADFGLDPPETVVRLSAAGRTESFSIGRATPSADEVYARAEGVRGVFTVVATVRDVAMRPASHFRRRALFGCSAEDVTGLALRRGDAPPVKLVRTKGGWRLSAPADAPADGKTVGALVRRLAEARVADFAPADMTPAHGGMSADDVLSVTVSSASGEPEKIVFGSMAATNLVYALSSDGKTVVVVDASLAAACGVGETALKDARVFPVAERTVVNMSVASGDTVFALSRTNGAWRLESPVVAPADAQTTASVLARVLSLKQADLAVPASVPRFSVTLTAGADTLSAASVPCDKLLGAVRLADLRDKTVFRSDDSRLKGVTVKTAAGTSWDASGSARLRARLAQGLVASRIETLEATPADFAHCGFEKPAFTLMVELDDADSPRRSILLGDAAADGGRHAVVGGSDAIFTLPGDAVADLTSRDAQ